MTVQKVLAEYLDANTFLVSKDEECIIIDSGASLDKVQELVQNKKVLAILLTHGHFDHSLFCLEYANTFNCPIYIHAQGKITLASPERNYGAPFYIDHFEQFTFLEGNGLLKLNNFTLHYYSTPGHSACSMCYKIDNLLFAGDTLFSNGIGKIDLIGSDKEEMKRSLNLLSTLQFDKAFSGHGEESDFTRQTRNIKLFQKFLSR